MLRSHSSAMVPPALRQLARDPGDDVLLVCPGMVYRRDAIDWQHSGTPHQLDLWRITRQAMSSADLDEMIAILLGALVPGLPHRQEPRTHPYTPTAARSMCTTTAAGWKSGNAGSPIPACWPPPGCAGRSGLALGMGLDRLLMLVKHIPDIRLLRSGDPRVTCQMLDLARYQHVSSMPPVTRDLSVAVPEDEDEETLGDRVRDALGADTSCVEEVRVLSATALRPAARVSGQPSRGESRARRTSSSASCSGTWRRRLTNETANALRDRIYLAIHQGTEYQWAHQGAPPGAA